MCLFLHHIPYTIPSITKCKFLVSLPASHSIHNSINHQVEFSCVSSCIAFHTQFHQSPSGIFLCLFLHRVPYTIPSITHRRDNSFDSFSKSDLAVSEFVFVASSLGETISFDFSVSCRILFLRERSRRNARLRLVGFLPYTVLCERSRRNAQFRLFGFLSDSVLCERSRRNDQFRLFGFLSDSHPEPISANALSENRSFDFSPIRLLKF